MTLSAMMAYGIRFKAAGCAVPCAAATSARQLCAGLLAGKLRAGNALPWQPH
jgi:hypothetical protein